MGRKRQSEEHFAVKQSQTHEPLFLLCIVTIPIYISCIASDINELHLTDYNYNK